MFDFLSRLFRPQGSSETAKERLRLVLLSDHLQLAPDVVEALKADLITVISKYVEVDVESCDVSFEQQDHAIAMLANIPILSMKVRTLDAGPTAAPQATLPEPEPEPAPELEPEPEPIVIGEPALEVTAATSHAHAAAPRPRRRRRKRRANAAAPASSATDAPPLDGPAT